MSMRLDFILFIKHATEKIIIHILSTRLEFPCRWSKWILQPRLSNRKIDNMKWVKWNSISFHRVKGLSMWNWWNLIIPLGMIRLQWIIVFSLLPISLSNGANEVPCENIGLESWSGLGDLRTCYMNGLTDIDAPDFEISTPKDETLRGLRCNLLVCQRNSQTFSVAENMTRFCAQSKPSRGQTSETWTSSSKSIWMAIKSS